MTIDQALALKPGDQFKMTGNIWEDPLYTVTGVIGETVSVTCSTEVGPPEFDVKDLEGYSLVGDEKPSKKK